MLRFEMILDILALILGLGLPLFNRTLAKLQIGPFYFFDLIWIVGFIYFLASYAKNGRKLRLIPSHLLNDRPEFLILLWGIVLLFYDFAFRRSSIPNPDSLMQTIKQSLIFVYPFLWITAGRILFRHKIDSLKLVAISVLAVQSFAYFLGPLSPWPGFLNPQLLKFDLSWIDPKSDSFVPYGIYNISLGPLILIPGLVYLFQPGKMKRPTKLLGLMLIVIGLLPLYMNLNHKITLQRTTFVLYGMTFILFGIYKTRSSLRAVLFRALRYSIGSVFTLFVAWSLTSFYGLEAIQTKLSSKSDPNDLRAFMWAQTVTDWKESPIIGTGFSVPIPSYIQDKIPNQFGALPSSSIGDFPELPVTGPHNSYLTVLARMGIVGFILYLWLIASILVKTENWLNFRQWQEVPLLVIAAVPAFGLFHAFLNVGFESPHNSILMWLFSGAVLGYSDQKSHVSK
jgi:hypothetical protein